MPPFIKTAIKRPGALTAKADAVGESPMQFAQEHAAAPGVTGQESRFAKLLARVRPTAQKRGYLPAAPKA